MNKMLMLYNPKSGSGKIRTMIADLVEKFTASGWTVTLYPTQAPGDAIRYLQENGRDYDRIVVSGGDGILHEAINGLQKIDFSVPLGYLPSGTVNDFANSHRIPSDILQAADLIEDNEPVLVDVGRFNDEYFSYIAACGVSTHVSYTTSQLDKKRFGPLAYIVNGLNTVDFKHWENNCVKMKVTWQDGQAEGDFLFASFSNTLFIGGMNSLVIDGASFVDGILEGLLIKRPMNLYELHLIASGILKHDFSSDFFIQASSSWFEIESEPADWTLDGEYGGSTTHTRIEALQKKLPLIRRPLSLSMITLNLAKEEIQNEIAVIEKELND